MFLSLCAAALLCAVTLLILREFGFRGVPAVAALCGVLLLAGYLGRFTTAAGGFADLILRDEVREAAETMLKVVGIGGIASLTCSVCEELGERSVCRVVTLAAKAEIFLVVFPYLSEAIGIGLSLLEEGAGG